MTLRWIRGGMVKYFENRSCRLLSMKVFSLKLIENITQRTQLEVLQERRTKTLRFLKASANYVLIPENRKILYLDLTLQLQANIPFAS